MRHVDLCRYLDNSFQIFKSMIKIVNILYSSAINSLSLSNDLDHCCTTAHIGMTGSFGVSERDPSGPTDAETEGFRS